MRSALTTLYDSVKKSLSMSVPVTLALKAWVERLAKANGLKLSELVRLAIASRLQNTAAGLAPK